MATLQKIRSKGVLLLIVIGLALLAFILGDAWKILRPNQGVVTVGEVNGKSINAQDYQNEVEKYASVVRLLTQSSSLSEDTYNSVKDEVWSKIISENMVGKETSAIGLKVTDAEMQDIIEDGTNSLLRQSPIFQNPQTGAFDVDMLKSFLASYNEMDRSVYSSEELNYYDDVYNYWCYVEENLRQTRLATKYMSLVEASVISNPISRKDSYEARTKRSDVLLATVPYTTISDSLAKVTTADVKKLYDERKEMFKMASESRDINYIDVEIVPSDADRAALLEEVSGYAEQLAETNDEFASFIRLTESEVQFSEVPSTAAGLPEDVAARLDSVNGNEVFGPYYYAADDTYNAFKIISTTEGYDSIQFAAIQVPGADEASVANLADSINNAISKGGDMAEIASKYSQSGQPQWISSMDYQGSALTGNNAIYLNKINSMKKGETATLKLDNVTLVLKVFDVKSPVRKYSAAIVKRAAYFSNETSNDTYNKLSSFVANNNTAELLAANAEENGYRLLSNPNFQSYSYNVGGVSKSHDALRWVFDSKPGEVSRIYEVGENSDHLLVVALNGISKKGYLAPDDKNVMTILQLDALKDKKAEMIMKNFSGVSSIDAAKSIAGVKIDTVKYVNFSSPSYVRSTFSSEPLLGAAVCGLAKGATTAPVKGEGGVWIAQKLSDDTYAAEFDDAAEASRMKSLAGRTIANQLLQELYNKSGVEDTRYKTF